MSQLLPVSTLNTQTKHLKFTECSAQPSDESSAVLILSAGQMVRESHMVGDTGSTGEGECIFALNIPTRDILHTEYLLTGSHPLNFH